MAITLTTEQILKEHGIDPSLPVAIYWVEDTGDAENGPGPLSKDFIGAYINLSAAQQATLMPYFHERPELNFYGLPVGCIPEQITIETFHTILNDTNDGN